MQKDEEYRKLEAQHVARMARQANPRLYPAPAIPADALTQKEPHNGCN